MREALARSDNNVARRSSASAQKRRSSASASQKDNKTFTYPVLHALQQIMAKTASGVALALWSGIRGLFTIVRRWPLAALGSVLGTGFAAAIIINAVRLQEGEHPSPIFSKSTQQTPILPAAKTRSLPPPRPQQAATSVQPVVSAKSAEPHKAATYGQPQATIEDPIAHLIANAPPPAQKSRSTQEDVLQVQQALAKLGYTITPDGRTGPATQQAIAAFEKLEALPVTGDPQNAAMRKALAIASGMTF